MKSRDLIIQKRSYGDIFREAEIWTGAFALVLIWLALMMIFRFDPLGHASHDSYTLQALAWREGNVALGRDYSWLELAVYQDNWYVSFPPVPTLVMYPLTWIFGERTPNTLVTGLYFLGTYFTAYAFARRFRRQEEACFLALFMTVGCSLLDFSLTGDVWNQAQLLCFFLTSVFVLGITGNRPLEWGIALACLALSVGCRPFQVVYVPFGMYRLYRNLKAKKKDRILFYMLPYLIFPVMTALALGWYNIIRFGNPLEFGHNYLPEFTRDPTQPQMGTQYILHNLENLFRLPFMNAGRLEFVRFDGFAFWMVNPIFVSMPFALIIRAFRRKIDFTDLMLLFSFAAEILALLMHKTLGGWQFGARYLCDLIPMMYFIQIRKRSDMAGWEKMIAVFAIAFNVYGSIVFRMMNNNM